MLSQSCPRRTRGRCSSASGNLEEQKLQGDDGESHWCILRISATCFFFINIRSVYVNIQLQLTARGGGLPGVSQAGFRQAAGLGIRLEEAAA